MKKILFVFVVLFVCASAFAESEIELVYKFTEGDTSVYKELQKEDVSGSNGSETMDAKNEMEFETTVKVVKVLPDGGAKLEYSSKPLRVVSDGESLLGEDEEDNKPSKILVEMSKYGKVLSLEDESGEKISSFSKDKQKSLLPETKVKIGSKWEGMIPLDSLDCVIKCTLDEIYSEKGVDIAKISFTFDSKKDLRDVIAESGEDMALFDQMNMSGTKTDVGSGKIYFSINLGKVILIEYKSDSSSSISVEGNSTKNTGTIDYKYWRIK